MGDSICCQKVRINGIVCHESGCMALIEWRDCGGLPTDICTWVLFDELVITRRPRQAA